MLFVLPWALLGGEMGSTTVAVDTGDPIQLMLSGRHRRAAAGNFCRPVDSHPHRMVLHARWCVLLLVSSVVFAAQHLHVGFSGFLTTFPVAFLLAWSFLINREYSRWRAYWVTSAIHACITSFP
jgi:hypothetical protein